MNQVKIHLLWLMLALPWTVFAAEPGELAEACDSCHGPQGVSSENDVPTIAGQPSSYINTNLKSYQVRGRPCVKSAYRHGDTAKPETTMCKISKGLSDEEIETLSKYYEAQKFVPAQQDFDPAKASVGGDLHEIHCETCHKMGGSIAGRGPRLAGQWAAYLRQAIKHSSTGEHLVPGVMEKRLNDFTAEEIDALVNFYASQQD